MRSKAVITSPCGRLCILGDTQLEAIEFVSAKTKLITPTTPIAIETTKQIESYFKDPKFKFDLDLNLNVTDFQQRVLNAMLQIPVGQTRTYGELAQELNTSARAIGNACRRNPIPVVIPCHRIVAKNGIGGFSGEISEELIDRKQWLLQHEKA